MGKLPKRFVIGSTLWGLAVLTAYLLQMVGLRDMLSETAKTACILVGLGSIFAGLFALLGEESD